MKGLFLSPKDEETALFANQSKNEKQLDWNSIKIFFKRQGFQSGISLLEALIALALLAFVLLTSVLVRFTTSKADLARVDELSAAAILRQGCMDFQAGLITNSFADTNTTNAVESGASYALFGMLHTNDLLRIQRLDLQVAVKDSVGNSSVNAFRSRWKYLPMGRISQVEPATYTALSYLTMRVYSTNMAKGLIRVEGVITDATNDVTFTNVYGATYTLVAVPKIGSTFSRWVSHSDNRLTNNIDSMTNTNVILDEDREIEAVFQ